MLYLILTIFSVVVLIIGYFLLKASGREANTKNILMILVLCLIFSGLVIMIVHVTAKKNVVHVEEFEVLSLEKYKVVKEHLSSSKTSSSSRVVYEYETEEFGEGYKKKLKDENVTISGQKSDKNTLEIVDYEYAGEFTKKLLGDRKWTKYEFFVKKGFIKTLPTRYGSNY